MKKMIVAAMVLASTAFGAVSATADSINVGGDIGAFSNYVWRGQDLNGNAAVQGDVVLSTDALEGLSVSAWFSNSGGSVQEWDFTLDYSNSVEGFGYSVGGIYYTFLHGGDFNLGEVYLGFSYDAVVSPFVTAYYVLTDTKTGGVADNAFNSGDIWIDFGAGTSLGGYDLTASLSAAIYSSVEGPALFRGAVADAYEDGLTHVTLSASKDIEVGDLLVTPSLMGTIPVISKAADGFQYVFGVSIEPEVVMGVNIAF